MQITAQNVIDLMQTAIIAFCLVRIIQLNMEIKDLKIRFKTILKTDRWIQNMKITSIKEPKGSKQEKNRNE